MERIKSELQRLRRLEHDRWKYALVLILALSVAGFYAFGIGGGIERDLYMRGDQHTTNAFTAFKMNGSQSNTQQSDFVEQGTENLQADWGLRAWKIDENGTTTEITSGSPVAVVTRTSNGAGIQSATYTPPETDLDPNDAVIMRVYIQVGSGWNERAEFITNRLNASQLKNDQWTVNYYTEYETVANGPPFNRYTRGTFYWGTGTFNSRVQGFNYTLAKVNATQLAPSGEVDTYPGQSFSHEVKVTCDAGYCQDVTAVPQMCNGRSCTDFSNVNSSMDLSWSESSHSFGTLSRGETASHQFTVTPGSEGEYRIRFNVTSSNVLNNASGAQVVDVHVADINVTSVEHENLNDAGIAEYETSDTLDWLNTTITAGGGTAFNATISPRILEPGGGTANWGPITTIDCGDLADGGSCEKEFTDFTIPLDAVEGTHNISVEYDWENFGPETNDTLTFEIVDVKDTFASVLSPDAVFQGESSNYEFSLTNEWSASLNNVNVSVNCAPELTCEGLDQNFWASLGSGQTINSNFNVSTSGSIDPGFYDVNVTVEYDNPNEQKTWTQVQNKRLKVTAANALVTTLLKLPDNPYRAAYSHNITSTDTTSELIGPLNGTSPINEGLDQQDHWVYGTWRGENQEFLRAYHQSEDQGGWNVTNVGDGNGNEYCAFQTQPVNFSACPNPPLRITGLWTFDESGSMAWDHINGVHGTLNGGVTQGATGVVGNAYDFDGSSGYVAIPDNSETEMSNNNRVTVSAWVYHDTDQAGWTAIAQKSDTSYNLQLDNNAPTFTIYDGAWNSATAPFTLNTGQWYHLTGTFDGSTIRLYVNGTEVATSSASGIGDAAGVDVGVGENLDATGRHFDGRIDQLRIYARALDPDEIQALYSLNGKLGTGISEPREFPQTITRGTQLDLKGNLENTGDSTASGVSLNWTFPSGWTNSSGNLHQFNDTVAPGVIWWNNVTSDISLAANRGTQTIFLESNNSAGDRGDASFEDIDVYANTDTDLALNTTDAVRGEKVRADIQLHLDTGGALENQDVILRDVDGGDNLGEAVTDAQGKASIVFTVPEKWDVTVHDIEARYRQNDSIYTRASSDTVSLGTHDYPLIANVSASPEIVGFGGTVAVNASVTDADLVQSADLNVTYPDGSSRDFAMTNISVNHDYGYNFSDTWQNGLYTYRIEATDESGYQNQSHEYQFRVRANASMNVVTDDDVYGPNQEVSLSRDSDIRRNVSLKYSALTFNQYAEDAYSDAFITSLGTSTFHTDTHSLDSTYFEMTERGGSPPSTPDEFEGTYTYETQMTNISRIDISSLGSVTGGTWDVEVRDQSAGTWVNLFSTSATTDTWNNLTVCSGSTCSDYVSNGEIDIRVHVTTDRGTAEDTYSVDYQKLRIEGASEIYSKNDNPSLSVNVGEDRYNNRRYYTQFDLTALPYTDSANIEHAELVFNVSGFGTGEIYHTKNFTSADSAETIHKDGAPPQESDPNNNLTTFSTAEGRRTIDVTTAVNETFDYGKRFVSFQFREEGEDTVYTIESPMYLRVNYTADSELFDHGTTNMTGYLVMRVQERSGSAWQNVGFPVVDQSAGTYSVEPNGSIDLAQVWQSNGGFNTQLRNPGDYRVVSRFVDFDGNTLETDSGKPINDSYVFRIQGAQLNLTDIEHENQYDYFINEYETLDSIQWINVTVNNSESEAVDAGIHLNVLDELNQTVSWGPDSAMNCGNIPAGGSCERQWDNSGSGYTIPADASSGTFTFRWNTTLTADNAKTVNNYSISFTIHDVPSEASSEIVDGDNKIYRNESVLYNFTVANPWSDPLEGVNVTISCNTAELGCTDAGSGSTTVNLGSIGPGGSGEASFNITTDSLTATGDYHINATLEYVNPGNEEKTWTGQQDKILGVRIPGALLNLTAHPASAVRGNTGYFFSAYSNNTYSENLTNEEITWTIPSGWSTSDSLVVNDPVHEPGEIVWNNFTASISSSGNLGPQIINISATNDQGREDNDFVVVDIYAPTYINVSFNESDPAINEPVTITGELYYDNGTPIENAELRFQDETTGSLIGTGFTDSTGSTTQTYQPGLPLGNHSINVSYSGSSEDHTLYSEKTRNLTVHDRPNITDVSTSPPVIGFGFNTTINATITDNDGVSNVELAVTFPNGSVFEYPMVNTVGSTWEHNFSQTWTYGTYTYDITANDTVGITSTESSSFMVFIDQTSSIQTEFFDYYPAEYVNLTDRDEGWWNQSWDFRRRIQVNETSGSGLEKYPASVTVPNLGSKTNSCEDLRVVEELDPVDLYVPSCNPSGNTTIYFATNVSASASENVYLYYGNSNATAYNSETFAYRINDAGTYDPGASSIDNIHSYNNENATFRQIEVTVFGGSLDATVLAYNELNDTWVTLFQGAPASGTTVVNQDYLADPRFTQVNVELQDTSNNPGTVSYTYNFTTPDRIDTALFPEQTKNPSVIHNTGEDFKGRVVMEVESNVSGSWQDVSIRHNDSAPRTFASNTVLNLANLWNDDPWFTDTLQEGFYRAKLILQGPNGQTLRDGDGNITRDYVFRLNPPQSDINIESIDVYNVTNAGDRTTDTSDLEDSGLNSTLQVYGGEVYRFEVWINNSNTAEEDWRIDAGDVITHFNLNSSWSINSSDIFYSNNTQTFTGGTFSSGNVEWDTSGGGTVRPGENASFEYIVWMPNNDELRNLEFRVNATAFLRNERLELQVIKREATPPAPLLFDLNTTSVTRGNSFKAFAQWSEQIGSAEAEYNSTTRLLNNFSVAPEGEWTNITIATDSDWAIGNHSFRFYATDLAGNQNATRTKWFGIYGLASIVESTVNVTRVDPGNAVRFECRVATEAGNGIENYNVSFHNETSQIGTSLTNATGWASTQYSSTSIGYQNLTCEIQKDDEKYYKTNVSNATVEIRIAEDQPPRFFDFGVDRNRIFKTTQNDTANFYSFWTDNQELDFGALVEGLGFYATTKEFRHEIQSTVSSEIIGALNGTSPINEGLDQQDHWVYGTLAGKFGEKLNAYHENAQDGGWNDTIVANASTQYCAFQTLPSNFSACPNPPPSTQIYWTFDESGAVAWDHVTGRNGGLNGGVTQGADGVMANAYSFDGTDDYVTAGLNATDLGIQGNEEKTIMAWVRPRSWDDGGVWSVGSTGTDSQDFSLRQEGGVEGQWRAQLWGTSYDVDFTYGGNNEWMHMAMTWNGTHLYVYGNGSQVANAVYSGGLDTGDGMNFNVGWWADSSDSAYFIDARIEDVRVYNRSLSQGEVQRIYSQNTDLGPEKSTTSNTLPDTLFSLEALAGTSDWANFTVQVPNNMSLGDRQWSINVNDTSSNTNITGAIDLDVWAWVFVDEAQSGLDRNPVGQGYDVTMYCNFRQGNGTGVEGYDVQFWDNNTASGYRLLGTNQTQGGSLRGFAQWTTSYLDTGAYEIKCNATEDTDLNMKPYEGFGNFSETLVVSTGDVQPPHLISGTYGLNTTAVYKGVGTAIESVAQWNESIDTAWVELNTTNATLGQDFISSPYTSNWTNYTFSPGANWSVGEHWIKTYVNDSRGNLNDTLEYLKFEVWGRSEVEWISPTGSVEKGMTELVCGVSDNQTGEGIENYQVSFYDDGNNLINTNTTDSTGEARIFYNTSSVSTGSKTWSCRIQDETSLYYNASANDTDSATVNLVENISARVTGDIVAPPSGTTVAQNRTFLANVSVTCRDGDCGEVNVTLRYNSSGTTADTSIPEGSGTPFHVPTNPVSCANMVQDETCYATFDVNSTGDLNSVHAIDGLIESDNAQVNDTEDAQVAIDLVLIMDLTFTELDFPQGSPGDIMSAPDNGLGQYNIQLDENSNDANGGVWIRATNLTRQGWGGSTNNTFIRPENTTWSLEGACAYAGSEEVHGFFSQVVGYLSAGDSITQCFWQEIPYGHYFGHYNGTITIKVNATE